MKPDEKPTTITLPDTPRSTTAVPVSMALPAPASTTAPAVHGSGIWNGAQDLSVSLPDGVKVPDTKQEYWDTLNQLGFRMKNQQESTTGPEREYQPWNDPNPVIPERPTPPLTRAEAEAICAGSWVLYRHGLKDAFFCTQCFALGRPHGCRVVVRSTLVRVECRCGVQYYRPPTGATDLPTKLANTTQTIMDRVMGRITLTDGNQRQLPTTVLQREEVGALRAYLAFLERHGLEWRVFCNTCWNQLSTDEDFAVRVSVQSDSIALACECRMLVGHDGH